MNDREYKQELRVHSLEVRVLANKIKTLKAWYNEMRAWMYVTCVYCGQPIIKEGERVIVVDALKEHNEQCPKHPLAHAKKEIERLRSIIDQAAVEAAGGE